jgi:2-keto-4-pentenoate hydratase/2-oxohepta-3-ene-1,7-dioic acid hydratase in catechol pathway
MARGRVGPLRRKGRQRVRVGKVAVAEGSVLATERDGLWYRWTPAHADGASPDGISVLDALTAGDRSPAPGSPGSAPLSPGRLLPPIVPPRNVICLGKNYRDHAAEIDAYALDTEGLPEAPIVFTKPAASLCGPRDVITVDRDVTAALDYEVELGIVIGTGGRHIPAADAERHIAGYTIVNDVTARDLQRRHKQWFLGKSLPAATPVGPVIASPDELAGLDGRAIRCRVNGELRQDARLGDMIFGIAETIAEVSRIVPLERGDLIAMGTPSGVGFSFEPPRFLQDGDRVICEIEGIGCLDNTVHFVSVPHDTAKESVHA